MSVQLLTEHHLEFLSLKGDFTGSSESILVKMPHCWKLYVTAQMYCLQTQRSASSYMTNIESQSFPDINSFVI